MKQRRGKAGEPEELCGSDSRSCGLPHPGLGTSPARHTPGHAFILKIGIETGQPLAAVRRSTFYNWFPDRKGEVNGTLKERTAFLGWPSSSKCFFITSLEVDQKPTQSIQVKFKPHPSTEVMVLKERLASNFMGPAMVFSWLHIRTEQYIRIIMKDIFNNH